MPPTIAPKRRDPIVPANKADRTGAGGILRRAGAEIRTRWAGLERDILAAFDRIPVYQLNDDRGPVVRYGITAQQLSTLADDLHAALLRWIAAARDTTSVFWWDRYVEEAAQAGTAQSVTNLTAVSAAYAGARSLAQVIYSDPYQTRVGIAKVKSYEHWTGLAAEQRATLAQVIGEAVADGKSPVAARKLIQERLQVGKAKALAYAQSDITDTLRQARIAEGEAAEAELGIKTALLWTSALILATRPWHASRNGKVYSRDEVRAFYAERGNRYNCRCGVTECLLDADGKPILTKKLQSTMANERKAWESAQKK